MMSAFDPAENIWPLDFIACGRRWCIAGGWAACPQLASDQDIWVFPDPHLDGGDAFRLHRALTDRWLNEGLDISTAATDPANESCLDPSTHIEIYRVGKLPHNRHLMACNAASVLHLLSGFDVSTHQCAITDDGLFVTGPRWTPINVPPVALLDTPHTAARMDKIRRRYGFIAQR